MSKINVVNYHITMQCNYNCKFCFAKDKAKPLPLDKQYAVCDRVKEFFDNQGITDGRLNFAGGEPLLQKNIYKLLEYCREIGLRTSIITNGSLLSESVIEKLKDCGVEMIGISVDSLNEETNLHIGRCTIQNKSLSLNDLLRICKSINSSGIKLKINTCITALNHAEDFSPFLNQIVLDRFKILKARRVEEINCRYNIFASEEQFKLFCQKHRPFNPVVEEDMENSYVAIYPDGGLLDNSGNKQNFAGNCLTNRIDELLLKISFNQELFDNRYLGGAV